MAPGPLVGLLSLVTDERKKAVFFSFPSQVCMPSKAKTTPVGMAWDSLGTVQMPLTKLNSKKLIFNAFF